MEWTRTKISNKISRSLGIMDKLERILPLNILGILYNSLILPHLQYCVLSWGFKSDRLFKLQKKLLESLHTVSVMPIRNHYWNRLICSNWRYHENKKHWHYIIDTNEMNLQNIVNQCWLNQMIIIHMILNISLFYINCQQRHALGGYV